MKKNTAIRHSFVDKIFLTSNFALLTLFLVIIAYPLLFVIFASVSGGISTLSLNIWPESWTFVGYEEVFKYEYFWIGYLNSVIYVVVGTLVSLVVTICCAYPLSRPDFKGGPILMTLCMITMYFSGGLIPGYLNLRNLHMLDSIWAIVLPGALSVYNMIVMRTYFKTSIPGELREAAYLDGCGDMRYLLQIVLPLSGAIIAVISLYVAVGMWNSYFGPMIFLTTRNKMPLSIFLRELLVINTVDTTSQILDPEMMADLARRQRVMKYAVIIVASVPVMTIYPFVQKYFVKGVMIGSVKG